MQIGYAAIVEGTRHMDKEIGRIRNTGPVDIEMRRHTRTHAGRPEDRDYGIDRLQQEARPVGD